MFDEPGSRDRTTEITYARHVRGMIRACQRETNLPSPTVDQLIAWFALQDFRYSAATVRSYCAALTFAAETEAKTSENDGNTIGQNLRLLAESPLPKAKGTQKRTSAKKVKRVPMGVVERLLALLDTEAAARRKIDRADVPPIDMSFSEAAYLAGYIRFMGTFFPRPNEIDEARIVLREPSDQSPLGTWLKLPNSKTTNGRSFGPERFLHLADDELAAGVAQFLVEHKRRLKEAGSPKRHHDRVRKALAAACRRAGVVALSPYSLRHLGMSAAKASMPAVEVAYAAGHGTDRTAGERYARARKSKGLPPSMTDAFSVAPEDAKVVRVSERATRAQNLERQAKRRADTGFATSDTAKTPG
jgi:integrase